jgi:release factor glutamine methyltransferase
LADTHDHRETHALTSQHREAVVRPSSRLSAWLWRLGLRLKFVVLQRHRHNREVVEEIGDLSILVRPGVFNPALFRVTPIFLEWLGEGLVPAGSKVLDLGTGTGVLAIAASSSAARVVAVDSNPTAVECARINAGTNSVADRVEARLGDLFAPVAGERFDLILCNPPYFAGRPSTALESAFRAGDFARRFAGGLAEHLADDGRALVILSSIGDEAGFLAAFAGAGLRVEVLRRCNLVSEIVTLYELRAG